METKEEFEDLFKENGYTDYKWMDPKQIEVAQWVRMKCLFGCDEYGKTATCPPNVPSVDQCRRFLLDYSQTVVFRFQKTVEKPEDRFAWTREVNEKLLELERTVFFSGHHKAFLLFMDSCNLCKKCTGERKTCKRQKDARPTAEALAIDVFATVRKIGYPINVLSDYDQAMNRYAFLFIE